MARTSTGQRLRRARLDAELSVAELSKESGVPEQTIYRIEAGDHQRPRMDTLRRLAKALGVTVADLLEEVAA